MSVLVIRDEQMLAFQPEADTAFEKRLLEHLRTRHADLPVRLPDKTLAVKEIPEAGLLPMIRDGIQRARDYGLAWSSSLASYVVLMFAVAPNFDDVPSVGAALSDEKMSPDERMKALRGRVPEADWQLARKNYDPAAWKTAEEA